MDRGGGAAIHTGVVAYSSSPWLEVDLRYQFRCHSTSFISCFWYARSPTPAKARRFRHRNKQRGWEPMNKVLSYFVVHIAGTMRLCRRGINESFHTYLLGVDTAALLPITSIEAGL